MKKLKFHLAVVSLVFFCACSSPEKAIVPLSTDPQFEDTYTIIWNGISNAYRYTDGNWKRDETYDYVFNVTQKRYQQQWKSIKSLHRLHPEYDGKAGARSQTMYFEINYALAGSKLAVNLFSSLGKGKGFSDREFRKQTLDFEVEGMSSFAPYDHIRIDQTYKYEEGLLEETVFLYKLKDGKEIPFMKNEEKAYFYVKGKLEHAPTIL
ncbi:hypothetical protein [Haliscomenobacter sp.]|uniref:hypothetical protein n=1 Tax=Haliscomenobacter sp. TaxID=2717303 RepID=UPI003BAD9914